MNTAGNLINSVLLNPSVFSAKGGPRKALVRQMERGNEDTEEIDSE